MKRRATLSAWNLDCRAASALASESLDRDLSRSERLGLRLHQLICSPCRQLVAQFQIIRQAVASLPRRLKGDGSNHSVELSAERRAAIKKLLVEATDSEEA